MKNFYLFVLILLLAVVNNPNLKAQNPEWKVYANRNSITCLADDSSDLWVGTTVGLVQVDKSTLKSTFYNTANSELINNYINCIAIDGDGNKWIGTGNGLIRFDGTNWEIYDSSNSKLPVNNITCLAVDNDNDIWLGVSHEGLVKFDGANWKIYNTSNSKLPVNNITCLAVDNDNDIWLGVSHKGLVKFDGAIWTVYNTYNSKLCGNNITCLAVGLNKNIWIGSAEFDWRQVICYGLTKFDGNTWTVYDTSNSELPDKNVECIAIDNDGNKWIGTDGRGLAKFDDTSWTVYNTANSSLPNNYISIITIEGNGNKWIATSSGLAVFNEGGIVSVKDSENKNGNYPDKFILSQNHPNPFNPSTTIKYSIPKQSYVTLKVYDILGREAVTLVNEEKPAGNYEIIWNANKSASGIYFYQIKSGEFIKTKKMILLK